MKFFRALDQNLFALEVVGVRDAAIHRTHRRARLVIIEAHALGALGGHDVVDVLGKRRRGDAVELPRHTAGINRGVGAFRFASSAVNTLVGDDRRHPEPDSYERGNTDRKL